MSRRGRGEGAIYQRADGRWVAALHLGYSSGRRKRRVFYARTRQEVSEKLREGQQVLKSGVVANPGRQTVEQYLVAWLDEVVRPNVRPKTLRTYETVVRVHLTPCLGRIRLSRLGAQDVQRMMNAVGARGRSARTVQMIRDVLRQALNTAVGWGLVSRNVAALVKSPRMMRVERRPLSPPEARRFVAAIQGHRHEALFLLALATGMRQGEILGLRWGDIDLGAGQLRVAKSLTKAPDPRLVDPKSERGRRILVLAPSVIAALRVHRTSQIEARLLAGARWAESDLAFTSTIGTPLDGSTITRRLHDVLALAGLPQITFHDLRHSCASLMLSEGISPRVVMETLGHSDIRLTMNVYTHVAPELQRDAAERMERLLS